MKTVCIDGFPQRANIKVFEPEEQKVEPWDEALWGKSNIPLGMSTMTPTEFVKHIVPKPSQFSVLKEWVVCKLHLKRTTNLDKIRNQL